MLSSYEYLINKGLASVILPITELVSNKITEVLTNATY